MPEAAFLKMYNEAVVRECASAFHFFHQRDAFGSTDWLQMVKHADALVELGDEFIDGVNRVAMERGLIDEDTATPVCPCCGRESCPGATRLQLRTLVTIMKTDPDS